MAAAWISGVIIAIASAVFGAVVGGIIGGLVAGAIGIILGYAYGWGVKKAKPYDATALGVWRFLLDHTWSLPNTVVGALYLGIHRVFGNTVNESSPTGEGTIVLTNGVFSGFATTLGTVQAGTELSDATQYRHELIHIFQARLFGPLYLPTVIVNYVIATILPYWLLYYDKKRWSVTGFGSYFMHGVYPHVWNEGWAYTVAK